MVGGRGEESDAISVPSSSPLFSSSFTPINTTPATPLLASGISSHPGSTSSSSNRQRNPIVAEYLGLEDGAKPTDFPFVATPPSAQPPSAKRKRASKAEGSNITAKRARKPRKKALEDATTNRANYSTELCPSSDTNGSQAPTATPSQANNAQLVFTQPTQQVQVPARVASSETLQGISPSRHSAHEGSVYLKVSSTKIAPIIFKDARSSTPTVPLNDGLLCNNVLDEDLPALARTFPPLDDQFDDGIDDDDLLSLTEKPSGSSDSISNISPRHVSNAQQDALNTAVHTSPPSLHSQATIQAKLSTQSLGMKPIVRSPFPSQIRDRSPVVGLTPNCLLRTCFRIGEAINVGRNAAKNRKSIFIELYARVLHSERTEHQQSFTFCDLFHSKKPYLEASYDAAIWRSVDLHEVDSRVFLSEGVKMCRCILATKSNGKEWIPTVLNIWAAKREDVMWVEGIINS